jgi:hypothetical protein
MALRIAAFCFVVTCTAFIWGWTGHWSLKPGSYDTAREWLTKYALLRGAASLPIGLPLGVLAAVVVQRLLRRPA